MGNETDHLALLKFKESISKDPSGIFASWNSSSHFCNWQGITCGSRHQRVTVLNLQDHGLHGFISPHLGNLSFLRILNLQKNSFNGNIPQELGRLFRLQQLILYSNTLEGEIPTNLTSCYELRNLDLYDNKLIGKIPTKISSLLKLESLSIEANNLTGQIPSSIGNLSSLSSLSMAQNNLEGNLPEEIGFLKKLTFLWVYSNKLSGSLPSSLYNLSSLRVLSFPVNQFNGSFPANMFLALPNLSSLLIGENQISGPIPTSISNASVLSRLDITNNQLVGQVPSLENLQELSLLDLSGNYLGDDSIKSWEFLYSLINSSKLFLLDVGYNNFGAALPNSIANLSTQLSNLYFGGNKISGQIPATLGNLINLVILAMESNHLTGIIPTAFGNLQELRVLNLAGNKLSGLRNLDLSENNLSGSILPALQNISALEYLNISFNMLDGEVPTKGMFKNASAIVVTGNHGLCGGIQELKLPLCPIDVKKQSKQLGFRLKVVITCVVVLLFLFFSVLAIYSMRKRNRKKNWKSYSSLPRIDSLQMVSYQSLYTATDGFSANNLIGSGSFGSVYKGMLEFEQELVAIKVLNLQRKGADRSFIAECNALRNIRHRNLVKILTCCSSIDYKGQEFKALVYKYMKNGSLESWLHQEKITEKKRILDLGQRLNVVIDIAAGLHYLHIECEQSIVHCDLKPSNILLNDHMVAHISDFGLARLLSTVNGIPDKHTNTIAIKGTLGYAPPEHGMGFEVSTRVTCIVLEFLCWSY
ncbi:hypothetical protein L6164_037604 [Bauhinia variegata]|uniref:Uncharacterized protein n=1 Tax=Bauhinia variegata TaxID=167791 RepID=A0ACB9KLA5_BAUVA|nr:hypothetical protein L6164_037604 [Bauhinia variegata]